MLQISDLHFGPYYLDKVGAALLDFARQSQVDLIAVTGDLTQRATVQQFHEAQAFLGQLSALARTVVVAGNHDIPLFRIIERLFTPYNLYKRYIHPELDFYTDVGDLRLVGLNSTHPYRRIVNGYLSGQQLRKCQALFSAPGADRIKVRVLALHHHLIPVPSFEYSGVIPRSQQLLEQLKQLDVHMVLSGHIHRAFIGNSLDIYAGKKRHKGMLMISCGTTTSRRGRGAEREKNSLNVIDIRPEDIVISHFMYFSSSGRFEVVSEHSFKRSAL
jgi:predicted MPP superfamily phosphohydrolase